MKSNWRKRLSLDLNVLQWAVPLSLAVTAFIFEFVEHTREDGLNFDLAFTGETIIFGLMGPIVVGFIIAWMRQLFIAEKQAIAEVYVLNRELEAKVSERTIALEQRNTELDQANQQLKHLDEMKSEFVSLVSHELRAPLTALNGGLEVALQSADTLPPAARHTLETMVGESARLTEFVQTILDVSRLEAGRLTLNMGPVAVNPILRRSVEVVLGARRSVQWNLPANIPPVWADEVHYEQIIRNLLRNADKYSPEESPIEIKVEISAENVSVEVIDHGIGITNEMQDKIFERFQRGQSEESALPGWGLGLYFAKKLAKTQGGALELRSPIWDEADAPGSAFTIIMPIDANTPDEDEND
ncbi:MAG: ATP-binding protein [Anaerolineales bacterium]|nr:ATP-binding protein [Anaerolineales bacterium]